MIDETVAGISTVRCCFSSLHNYVKAWEEACRALDAAIESGDLATFRYRVECIRVLRGDPNKHAPTGVINVPATKEKP